MSKMFSFIDITHNPLGGACPHECSHCWAPGEPWTDVGTRCQDCLRGLEDLPRITENEK